MNDVSAESKTETVIATVAPTIMSQRDDGPFRGPSKNSNNESEQLGRQLNWAERLGFLCGAAVVGGLLVEYGPEMLDDITRGKPPSLVLIGGIMVTLGVAGEVLFEGIVSKAARRIQELADRSVAEAIERAAKAELELEQLRADALRHQAEAEHELNRLKVGQEPRYIMFGLSLDHFIEVLQTKNKGSAEVLYQPNDGESERFAKLILHGLAEAGWETKGAYPIESIRSQLSPTLAIGAQATGVIVFAPPDSFESSDSPVVALAQAFGNLTFPTQLIEMPDASLPKGMLRIVVGAKA